MTAVTNQQSEEVNSSELFLLFALAPLVGEKGADLVERVACQLVKGNTRAYRAELNRITAKFIMSIEAQSSF